jgi:hypothetical protein
MNDKDQYSLMKEYLESNRPEEEFPTGTLMGGPRHDFEKDEVRRLRLELKDLRASHSYLCDRINEIAEEIGPKESEGMYGICNLLNGALAASSWAPFLERSENDIKAEALMEAAKDAEPMKDGAGINAMIDWLRSRAAVIKKG